jgi:hypothetical protein
VGRIALLIVVLAGLVGVAVFGWSALKDWGALRAAYAQFDTVAQSSTDMPTLFIAEAKQNIHRINLFADGVWTLLSAILAAIGLHGLCLMPVPTSGRRP